MVAERPNFLILTGAAGLEQISQPSEMRADILGMDPQAYFEQITSGLSAVFGAPRMTRNGVRFGGVGIEYECVGSTMIVFLSTLNWMQYMSWDGAVHIDMPNTSITEAVRGVRKMMELGRQRVNR